MLLLTALRQTRQIWCGVLLGVLLALLPLRGWAEAVMHLSAPAPTSAASEASVVLPCHAAMAEHSSDVSDVSDESASGCALCSLCHGAAMCSSESCIEQDAAAATAPAALPQGYGPPALPLPERPPRV